MGKTDDTIKLAKQMGDAAKAGDEKRLAELAAQIPKNENGEYIV
jgi:hypothetical protein